MMIWESLRQGFRPSETPLPTMVAIIVVCLTITVYVVAWMAGQIPTAIVHSYEVVVH